MDPSRDRHGDSWMWSVSTLALSMSSVACAQLAWQKIILWQQSTSLQQQQLSSNQDDDYSLQQKKTVSRDNEPQDTTTDPPDDSSSPTENQNILHTIGMTLLTTVGCAALVVSTNSSSNTIKHNNTDIDIASIILSWVSWGSGLWALQSLLMNHQQSLSGDTSSNPSWILGTLLYTTWVPPPSSRQHYYNNIPATTLHNSSPHPPTNNNGQVILPCLLLGMQFWMNQRRLAWDRKDDHPNNSNDNKTKADHAVDESAANRNKKKLDQQNAQTKHLPASTTPPLHEESNHHNKSPAHETPPASNKQTTNNNNNNKRYLEILVHNVSHTDLVLSLDTSTSSNNQQNDDDDDENDIDCLCRPRFSLFDAYCRGVLHNLTMRETLVSFPRYQRSMDHDTMMIMPSSSTNALPIPTGMELVDQHTCMASLSEVRVRGKDHAKVQQQQEQQQQINDPQFPINNVFFPLLASLLPRWESMIADKQYRPWGGSVVKRVLILVTGVGTPRNWTHSVSGNSTQACADLMEIFVRKIDPTITVVKIHSETNIFRYDENLVFVQQELLPVLHSYRDAHARGLPYPDEAQSLSPVRTAESSPFDVDWRNSLSVSLSFADGSPARTYAIQAGLRPYRPTFMHFWQLKTFWHESKIVDDDLEVYAFEAMETSPAVDIQNLTDRELQLVVDEMLKFKDEMLDTLKHGHGDIKKFWLRKTHKPVLAVLLVQNPSDPNGPPILYRGTNMEVSMPTGSLCAERNVIGTALAANPNLKREHLKMVAVLAVPPPSDDPLVTSAPPSTNASVAAVADPDMKRVNSVASFGGTTFAGSASDMNYFHDRKISIGSEADEWMPPSAAGSVSGQQSSSVTSSRHMSFEIPTQPPAGEVDGESNRMRTIDLYPSIKRTHSMDDNAVTAAAVATTPTRKNRKKSIVVLQSSRDLNPLKPCGACNEWLKKIAECNPYFQVVTFTDANCNGIYCMPCQE